MLIKICDNDGVILFAGYVDDEDVLIDRRLDSPSTAIIRVPIKTMMSYLEGPPARRKCTCSLPTYYYDPEGAKGHCTCGAL